MDVLCVGHAAWDISVFVASYPAENSKREIHTMIECGGGPAANAAFLLSRWGVASAFAVKLSHKARETGNMTLMLKGGARFTEVDGIGAALICFRRDVLLRVYDAYPELHHKDGVAYFAPSILNEITDADIDKLFND